MTVGETVGGADGADFFATLPSIEGFEHVSDPSIYRALPDDWEIGLADVVASTEAIAAGRYKAVNTAGAAAISAVSNALGTLDFPFVFTGDGMCYAVAPAQADTARQALAATLPWVRSALNLTLRGGIVTVGDIRATGRDVRVAKFAPSSDAAYAMFSGGGLAWAEGQLKAGLLPPLQTDAGARPDLSGLSCRFKPLKSEKGVIVSIIVSPRAERQGEAFGVLVDSIVALIAGSPEAARPISEKALNLSWPASSLGYEARLGRRNGESMLARYVRTGAYTLFAALIMWSDRTIGRFSPARYRGQIVENSDFRKYEDGLMMTVDCTPALADRIEAELGAAQAAAIVDFGMHRQNEALITCIVPSPTSANHVHLIDGAAGGYASAANALKRARVADRDRSGAAKHAMPSSAPGTGPMMSRELVPE